MKQVEGPHVPSSSWKAFCIAGGIAALVAALVFRRWLGAEYMLLRGAGVISSGPTSDPVAVVDWFGLLQSNRLVGLTLLNAFDLINYGLVGLIFFGLSVALRPANRAGAVFAVALCWVGVAIYFASNQAFALLSLSEQYAWDTSSPSPWHRH